MTTTDERYNALDGARRFLISLLYRELTPGVPNCIRKEAHACLRHYPWPHSVNEWRKRDGLHEVEICEWHFGGYGIKPKRKAKR